ncbi:MAG: hypothetical protein IAG10_30520, partial [Planctomycetaceae bacterium]|nr:hypothetical protein [Planctomycetaceae bacterium]
MKVRISDSRIPVSDHGEIEHLLQQVAVGDGAGRWPDQPDEVDVTRRLTGGKSGAEVLEAVELRGNNPQRKVIKLGPLFDLHNEYKAFKKYLNPPPSKCFVPIEAVSERLLIAEAPELTREREVVVYNHAAEYQGATASVTRTFDELAREAMRSDEAGDEALRALERLFQGIRGGLYGKWERVEKPRSHRVAWNWRLGFDAVASVDGIDAKRKRLKTGSNSKSLYPKEIADRSVSLEPAAGPERILLANAKVEWWGDWLIAETAEPYFLRVRIESGDSGATIRYLAKEVVNGAGWDIEATVTNWRQPTNRDRLMSLLAGFQLADGRLTGDGVSVRDPFPPLADVLNRERDDRITCVAHGDLNPRNILLVEGNPCLIDYAFTRDGEPLMSDFVRLEGCLLREALANFTWSEHVRLQRLLALACRLGDDAAAERLANQLTGERAELGRAFRLLWAVRRAARDVAPEPLRAWWDQDYLEQLFLFGHLMLKWLHDGDHSAATVAAAITGVVAEAIVSDRLFALWSDADLRRDIELILSLLLRRAEPQLATLASLAQRLPGLGLKADDPLWRDFRTVRQQLVRRRFADEARLIRERLESDHDVFIHLKAFIDLKGQLKAAAKGRIAASTFDELLESDEALNERERLRAKNDRPSDDALLLIANQPAVVLLGDAGAGKSTIAREWEFRLAKAIQTDVAEKLEPRLPIVVRASEIAGKLGEWKPAASTTQTVQIVEGTSPLAQQVTRQSMDGDGERRTLRNLFETGAASLVVDALNELADADKLRVAEWILAFRESFPLTPLLACHRQYNYPAGLLPFPIVTLQKVEQKQARSYIRSYLREKLDGETSETDPDELATKLIGLLLDSPDHEQVRDLAQTPLFLWMIVERYRQTQVLPANRAKLFDDFSRWYLDERHHSEHAEPTAARHPYEAKGELLGRLGHELVQRRATELALADAEGVLRGSDPSILDEIITAEMLHRENGKLRFLHQSFQEYFAARHVLTHLAQNSAEIETRVLQFGWHDTFVLVLGFGGENPEVVRQVVETALAYNPRLTARCLRMAETDDRSLLKRFVAVQRAVLADHSAGKWAHNEAAESLGEYGRGSARAALWEIATASTAPETARVQTLQQLAGLPKQVRMESVAEKLKQEFLERLPVLFNEPAPAPTTVQQAAIGAIQSVMLKDLSGYLIDLVTSGDWPLRRAAWQACEQLGLQLTPGQRKTYVQACAVQLGKVEEALYAETVTARMRELNDERLAILEQLATPDNLPLLLRRRFAFITEIWSDNWNERVAGLLEECVSKHATATNVEPAAQVAWSILRDEPADLPAAIGHWLAVFVGDDQLAS